MTSVSITIDAPPCLLPIPRHIGLKGITAPFVVLSQRLDPGLPEQGYEIEIDGHGAHIRGADAAGAFYAHATLKQLACNYDGYLRQGTISDYPDRPTRGVMIDISRNKVPTLDTLKDLVVRLAGWKINHIQLYMEHTFAYEGHEDVWRDCSPMTAQDLADLEAFCREYFIELSGNQNCLGHMERWLKHKRYSAIALSPAGSVNSIGIPRPAMTIDPEDECSRRLITDLLSQLAPCLSSRRLHVGLDEPWEMDKADYGKLVTWLRLLRDLDVLSDHKLLVWGDTLTARPDLLESMPEDVVVCEWGYEAGHPFAENAGRLAAHGIEFWVCPGTSSWLSILGRTDNMVVNCLEAAQAGEAYGASGYLITDWGDNGHLQQPFVSDPGFAFGAAVAWCLETNRDIDLGQALNMHRYNDRAGIFAKVVLDLGNLYRYSEASHGNMSILTAPLYYPDRILGCGITEGLTSRDLWCTRALLAECGTRLERARLGNKDGMGIMEEVNWSISLMLLLIDDALERLEGDGSMSGVSQELRIELAVRAEDICHRYETLWTSRNRPGGLQESRSWLARLRENYYAPIFPTIDDASR